MRMFLATLLALFAVNSAFALEALQIAVGAVVRTALVSFPSGDGPSPLVIAYHGAGNTSDKFQASTNYEKYWPEAIVVYPQALAGGVGDRINVDGRLAGWQSRPRTDNDRDIKFFDQIVAEVTKRRTVDPGRIYVTGQSNGGGHVFLLWLARGEQVAAFAPCSGQTSPDLAAKLVPRPFLMISGQHDTTVPFANQKALQDQLKQRFEPLGIECQIDNHSGGHDLPTDGPQRVMQFFHHVDQQRGQPSTAQP